MGRKKTPEQELERESRARFMDLFSDWIVNSHDEEDFGFDFDVRPTGISEDGQMNVSSQNFHVQLKASEKFEGDETISHTFQVDYLINNCLLTTDPVVLFLYERCSGEFYWRIIQEYCWDELDKKHDGWRDQKYVTIRVSRRPLNEKRKSRLKKSIYQAQERIVYRLRISSLNSRSSSSFWSTRVDFPTGEDIVEYKMRRIEIAQKLIDAGDLSIGYTELLKVYEMPEEDLGKFKAITTFLDKYEITHPVHAIKESIYAHEGIRLAKKLERYDLIPELNNYRNHSRKHIEKFFVGARFLDTRTDEEVIVLQIVNWTPDTNSPFWTALLQYETGEFHDESAEAIGMPNFELLERGEGRYPLKNACEEKHHDFGDVTIHELHESDKCAKCGLSIVVLSEACGQDVWRSTGERCRDCGYMIPGDAGCEDWGIDIDGYRICSECWEAFDDRFGVPVDSIGSTFEIYCDECDNWQGDFVPDDRNCPNCGDDHLMIRPA